MVKLLSKCSCRLPNGRLLSFPPVCALQDFHQHSGCSAGITCKAHAVQDQVKLYDVDVTCSRYLLRPEVLRAAHFAALAHEGQVCLTQTDLKL